MANKNPSPSTRFGAKNGNKPNCGGKTKEQKRIEMSAAMKAARIREIALEAILERLESEDGDLDPLAIINKDVLKLFKDSEDRAFGTPKQSIDLESPDGSMSPSIDTKKMSMSARKELLAAIKNGETGAD